MIPENPVVQPLNGFSTVSLGAYHDQKSSWASHIVGSEISYLTSELL
jgi:hypothetical protein